MDFIFEEYKPIDYRLWTLGDEARQGINIKRLGLLNEGELDVFNEAIQYNDARNDPGQAEIVAYFAIILLKYLPGIREVAVPTSICHDIGCFSSDPDEWFRKVKAAELAGNLETLNTVQERMPHQIKGTKLSKEIYEKVNYPPEKYREESYFIIMDHDTRLKSTTQSGNVMRDADYLWRVTLALSKIYLFDKGITNPIETIKRAELSCLEVKPPRDLKGVAKQIAKIELANTIYFKFPDQAEEVLKPKYSTEFELVKRF